VRVTVVGGGIVGLATAHLIGHEWPDSEVVVLEKEPAPGLHQTAHNSGVVHAGLYYEPGSLKARLCRRGAILLKRYCARRELPYQECGKVVVARDEDELAGLDRLEERARANGVPGLRRITASELRAIEPHVAGVAALQSPETAIVDFHEVASALAHDIVGSGGSVRTSCEAGRIGLEGSRVLVELADGGQLLADRVIVCVGLWADRLARVSNEPTEPRIIPFRGEYWQLRQDRTHLVRGLVYPVPDPALPFLGVHLTRKLDGSVLIGPNAVLALAREGYRRSDFKFRDAAEALTWPGTARMMRRHWRVGVSEIRNSLSKRAFIQQACRYVPGLRSGDVVRAGAGVRAQAIDRDGSLVDDFRLGGDDRVVWVRNAPSPAATSSLAIAEELAARLNLDSRKEARCRST
jgi:L-2-hydroxyglutarate oxidase LhgO